MTETGGVTGTGVMTAGGAACVGGVNLGPTDAPGGRSPDMSKGAVCAWAKAEAFSRRSEAATILLIRR
jgi:hypothetical protein